MQDRTTGDCFSLSFCDIKKSMSDSLSYSPPESTPKKKGRKKRSELESSGIFIPVLKSTKGVYKEQMTSPSPRAKNENENENEKEDGSVFNLNLGAPKKTRISYKNIARMCHPLKQPLSETNLRDLKSKNLFPYVDTRRKEYGFMFQDPDGSFRDLSLQNWRKILHGKTNQLRPKGGVTITNRKDAWDGKEGAVKICYWPDKYHQKYVEMMRKASRKRKNIPVIKEQELEEEQEQVQEQQEKEDRFGQGGDHFIEKAMPPMTQNERRKLFHQEIAHCLLRGSSFFKHHQ